MYKSHISPEQEESVKRAETVEQFLARGGKIQTLKKTASVKNRKTIRKASNKIDAQKLLDEAMAAGLGDEAIAFLQSQGIEVQ